MSNMGSEVRIARKTKYDEMGASAITESQFRAVVQADPEFELQSDSSDSVVIIASLRGTPELLVFCDGEIEIEDPSEQMQSKITEIAGKLGATIISAGGEVQVEPVVASLPLPADLRYGAPPERLVLMAGAALAFAIVMTLLAKLNDGGLIINGSVTLDRSGAKILLWSLAAFIWAAFICVVALNVLWSIRRERLTLTVELLTVPQFPLRRGSLKIPLEVVQFVGERKYGHSRMLMIGHPGGEYALPEAMLEGRETYERFKKTLADAVQSRREMPRANSDA